MDLDAGTLLAGLLVSTVGFGFFHFGKKQRRTPQLVAGIAMMVYPTFVASPMIMVAIAVALIGGVVVAVRMGA